MVKQTDRISCVPRILRVMTSVEDLISAKLNIINQYQKMTEMFNLSV